MIFHEIGPEDAPLVALVGPEFCGWWAMAPISKRLTGTFRCLLVGHDGFGEAYATPFTPIVDEGRELAAYARDAAPAERFRAIVGVGLGGQVAVEALCEDSECAECLVLGDVLCEGEPGSKGSAWLNGASWGLMRRPRYARSQLEGLGIPQAMLDVFVRDAAATPKATVKAMTQAVETWRIPDDIGAIRCPTTVTCAALQSGPRRASGEALAAAIAGASLKIQRDLSRNELYLRYPDRLAEWLLPWLERRGAAG